METPAGVAPGSASSPITIHFGSTSVLPRLALSNMKRHLHETAAFSLVEVTLAIGIAAFCLIAVLGLLPVALTIQQASIQQTTATAILSTTAADLRAAVRYPPGLASHLNDQQRTLKGHWALVGTPDTLYYTKEAIQTGGVNSGAPPADAVF